MLRTLIQAHLARLLAAVALSLAAGFVHAVEAVKIRASLDGSPSHVRTKIVQGYLEAVKERSEGQFDFVLYHSAQLYRDRDVPRALRQGSVDIGFPVTPLLGGIERNMGIFELPMFYGVPAEVVHRVTDGEVGQMLDDSLEQKLGVKVFGKWLDMGFVYTMSATKPIRSGADMAGLKIRVAGAGATQFARMKYFKATPNQTAWPDVPLALSQGAFDALLTTSESAASAKLWEAGVKYAFEDNQQFVLYVPMVSKMFWEKLTPSQQRLLTDIWAERLPAARKMAADAQAAARAALAANGVNFHVPAASELASVRAGLLGTQDAVVKEMNFDPELVNKAAAALQSGR